MKGPGGAQKEKPDLSDPVSSLCHVSKDGPKALKGGYSLHELSITARSLDRIFARANKINTRIGAMRIAHDAMIFIYKTMCSYKETEFTKAIAGANRMRL